MMETLHELPALEILDLRYTRVSNEDLVVLAASGCPSLKTLKILSEYYQTEEKGNVQLSPRPPLSWVPFNPRYPHIA